MRPQAAFYKQNGLFNIYLFLFFAALTFALYFNSISNFYVLDDFVRLKAASEGALSENFHFFPLPLLVYRILYLLFGISPAPLRIFNYLLNALMCVLVFRFSFTLINIFLKDISAKNRILISFSGALLFCVHYIHVETIVYYSELHEMFYSVFYLSGLYFYLLYRSEGIKHRLIYVFISFLCCILSKETAVTFLACIFLSEWLIYKSSIKDFVKRYYPLLLTIFVFASVRYFFFSRLDILSKPSSVISEILKNYIFSFTAFVVSLDFVLIKDIYKNNNTNLSGSLYDIFNLYPMALFAIIVSIALYILILRTPVKLKYVLLILSVITISSFAWLAGYERYLYLPSAGFCLLLSLYLFSIRRLYAFKKIPLYIIFTLIIIYQIYNLKEKESQWITASGISEKTISRIVDLTRGLPAESKVYLKDLPGEYKSAWILRYGIHEVPGLFLKRNDMKFYYIYQKPEGKLNEPNVYVYDHSVDKLYKEE
jgi:protein O-mannosyl-transferase